MAAIDDAVDALLSQGDYLDKALKVVQDNNVAVLYSDNLPIMVLDQDNERIYVLDKKYAPDRRTSAHIAGVMAFCEDAIVVRNIDEQILKIERSYI
jgi:hypothetical protein